MAENKTRPSVAKGRRPYFFDDPSVDKLLAIIMALAAEVSVLRERLDTHERLAEGEIWPSASNLEQFTLDDVAQQQRAEGRAEFLKRILRVVSEELERMGRDPAGNAYPEIDRDAN